MKKDLKNAIEILVTALKTDEGYRESWKANIAIAFKDDYYWYKTNNEKDYLNNQDIHIVANNAADNFLKILCR
jgi:uncharacterized protein YdaT